MKINIKRDGQTIKVVVGMYFGSAGEYTFGLEFETPGECWAGLLHDEVSNQFAEQIKAIRRDAYEQGWRDKTKRRQKRQDFDWCFNVRRMPYEN